MMKKFFLVLLAMAIATAPRAASADIVDIGFDVTGILSMDGPGDPDNEIHSMDLGAGFDSYQVIGIGWDVELFADSPSWLSEMTVRFVEGGLDLTPGVGVDNPGTQVFSSGGVVDLVGLALDWTQLSNILTLEFFETFVDYNNDWDGIWNSGTLTVRVERFSAIPEPSSLCVLAVGAIGLLVRRRRV
ncbi:MAG: PEP-CTERM sorting domain-containing protein [Pirellulaceae bacterium]|nr:PEP-CTERM sorting domain-containing protein [Pirellulaceae bacterium]